MAQGQPGGVQQEDQKVGGFAEIEVLSAPDNFDLQYFSKFPQHMFPHEPDGAPHMRKALALTKKYPDGSVSTLTVVVDAPARVCEEWAEDFETFQRLLDMQQRMSE